MALELAALVVSVTVYPGQARVTRRGLAALPDGDPIEVVLGGLPLTLVHESVRVTGRGAGAITGLDVRTVRHSSDTSARVAELLAEQQRLAIAAQELADRRRVLDVSVTFVESVASSAGRPYAKHLVSAAAGVDDLGQVADRISDQLALVLAAKRALLTEERDIVDAQRRVDRELSETGGPQPDRTEVAVAVAPGGGGDLELEVSYLVDGATWEPRYDVRLDDAEVEVTWFGMVRQWSGEDWPECELRLSTARPTAGIQIPDLDPWFLAERQVPRPRAPLPMAVAAFGAGPERDMAVDVSALRLKEAPVEMVSASVEQGVTATTYVVRHAVAVPADGTDHQALVTRFRLPARIDHLTAPVVSDDVYLRATVTNTSEHTLRAGRASLFHGTEFVGVSDLDVLAPGEDVALALGLDDRVRVERELVARSADKTFLGAAARHEARWRTRVANHTGKPATITVVDQVPVSRSPGITVKDVRLVPDAVVDDVGEVTWSLQLPDGGKAELMLGVRIEVAKGVEMVGWRE